MKPIRLVCGTRKTREQFADESALGLSVKQHHQFTDVQLQLFESNTRGLPSIYNEAIGVAEAHPAILAFVHDDVWLNDFFWPDRIYAALQRFDVVGVAGNRRRLPHQPSWLFATPTFRVDDPQYLSGVVGHGRGFPCEVSVYGPPEQACQLLDGLLLVVDSAKLIETGLRFDERFDFHFYDMDFCRQAEAKGLTMGTWPLSVTHESGGGLHSAGWREGYQRYLTKYGD